MSAESDFLPMLMEFFQDDPLTVIYQKFTQGSYNPATSEYSSVQVDTPCKAILLDLTRDQSGLSRKFGTLMLAGDKELYLLPPEKADTLASPLVIDTTNDRVVVNGVQYKVENMKEINPNGANPIVYDLMLRR